MDPQVRATPFFGERFHRDPAAVYRRLRHDHGPVAPVQLEGGVTAWCVLGYREVHHVVGNPELFSRDPRRWNRWHRVPECWSLRPYVEPRPSALLSDGEDHRARGHVVREALATVDLVELAAAVERISDTLIDRFAARGSADLVVEYTHQVPLLAMAQVYGLPDDDAPMLTHDVALTGQEGEEAVRAHERTVARMLRLVRERREDPAEDLVSNLVQHPVGFADEEVATDLFLVLGRAHLTTSDWMGNALRLMLTEPRFALGLAGGRSSVAHALNEVLWEDTPTQNHVGRWATRDVQLGGQTVRRGDLLVLCLAAANADPQVRPRGHEGATGNHAHLAFSHGEHGCPHAAQEIARTITTTGIEVLLDRLPDTTLDVEPGDLTWRPSVLMRGLTSLPVTFSPH
ncbi:cytochrome P450 [Saccharopolyspora rhizosphaerae]|uniref:Cytochrome P450 n=1 Tax=Saccharopolyspora rhizosphaerae TaxID=2492662 RepID=A0A426JWW4_9PSEU|nr:cytochrome P450 [Saccharopolyspora rhizosphaerae]RRO17593.1 cytochrome P450 [Saccharopolyspora rhizosphaerae]